MTVTEHAERTGVGRQLVERLGLKLFDADNHYYESPDCFTRHLDPQLAKLAFRWATVDGNQPRLLVNGRVLRMIVNPTFDPVAAPGGLTEQYRSHGDVNVGSASQALERLADHPEYQNREARLQVMDRQLVEKSWLFPTLGVIIEEYFTSEPELTAKLLSAFNRWLAEDWGFAYKDRMFAVPMLSLADLDAAVRELEWVLSQGAKVINLRGCPVPGGAVGRSLFDPRYDRFWSIVNESRVVVAFHAGDLGHQARFCADWGENPNPPPQAVTRFHTMSVYRSAYDTAAALCLHGLFDRFPNIRCIFVELGAEWVPFFLKNLAKNRKRQDTGPLSTRLDPVETFHKHIWIEPYPEQDLSSVIDVLGEDRVVFGSDWPHVEGTTNPSSFFDTVHDVSDTALRKIMRENALSLMGS